MSTVQKSAPKAGSMEPGAHSTMQELNLLDLNDEPLPPGVQPILPVGSQAPDLQATLTTSQEIKLSALWARGPVLLNFIKGTWCPFCQQHLAKLRQWQAAFSRQNSTILVLSNEPVQTLRDWTAANPLPYLFGSVQAHKKVFDQYGVQAKGESFAKPATFLIDHSGVIKMAYDGTRGLALQESCKACGIGLDAALKAE